MKSLRVSCIILLLIILLPSLVWAAPTSVPLTDKSMQYLGIVFGQMGSLIVGSGNALFGRLMLLFNQIVLSLATLIVIYTAVISTLHTAHEGEVMGKKWSPIFIPFRIGVGLWLLVPSSSGYSYIQIVIMWFLIQGVGIANNLWEQVLLAYDRGQSIRANVDISDLTPTTPLSNSATDENALRGILRAQICVQLVNNNPEALEQLAQGIPLSAFQSSDGTQIIWGTQDSEQPVCGALLLPTDTFVNKVYNAISGTPTNNQFKNQLSDLILNTINPDLEGAAQEAATMSPSAWRNFSALITAQSEFTRGKQAILTQAEMGSIPLKSTLAQNALADGWIHAGSYYMSLIAGNQNPTSSTLSIQVAGPNFSLIGGGDLGQTITQKSNSLTEEYLNRATQDRAETQSSATRSRMTAAGSDLPWPFNEIIDAISSPFWDVADQFMSKLSGESDNTDPMIAISQMGGLVVSVTEGIFLLAFIPIVLLGLATSIARGFSALGHVFSSVVLTFLLPVFMLFLAFFYTAGIVLALYIPLIPFLVFTFAAMTWIILVIEAIVAAPLVALILVVPSEDELGKAGHSLVILLGLVLRPALMILGFIVAIKLLLIGVKLLNFGFSTVVYENRPAFSLFFPVAVVVLYTGVLTYIVHEAFSLIYVIPDKVLRWMGGTPEGEDIMSKVKKGESDIEKGAGAAKSGLGAIASAGKSAVALPGQVKKSK